MITVKQFIEKLQQYVVENPEIENHLMIMYKDGEGNGYGFLWSEFEEGLYSPDMDDFLMGEDVDELEEEDSSEYMKVLLLQME